MAVEGTKIFHSYLPASDMAEESLAGMVVHSPATVQVERVLASGARSPLTEGSDYQLGGSFTAGAGWIKALASEAADTAYEVLRVTPRLQQQEFTPHEPIPANELERAVDIAMQVAQEQDREIGDLQTRAVVVPQGETAFELPAADDRASKALFFDADGNPDPQSLDDFSAAAAAQADMAEGFALTLEANAAGGYYGSVAEGVADAAIAVGEAFNVIADGRHYVARKTAADAGEIVTEYNTTGAVLLVGQVNASSYTGADDTAALNAAIAAAAELGTGAKVWLERDYSVTGITNPYGVELAGPGRALVPITGGTQQLNSYADAPGRIVYGEEYLDRVMQRLKLGASGSSGQIGCFLYGDSTVAGGYMSMSTVDLVKRLFHVRGVGNIAVTNRGVAGTTVADLNVLADLAATTDLAIIKYGINDGGNPDGTRLATFRDTLDAKLTAIRAAANGGRGNLAIVLVGPNATADTPNGRDERWYEQLHGVFVEAAREHKCAYVNVYGYMRDARGGALVGWDDPYADGRTVHPTDSVGARIWGLVVDAIIPAGWAQWWGTSLFRNVTATANAPSATATPSQFLTGKDHARATIGNNWPIDGFVDSLRSPDGGVLQLLYPYAADDTRVMARTANVGADTWNRWTGAPEGLTLQNGWVPFGGTYGTAKAYIDLTKNVHCIGSIKSGTTTAGTLLFTLPAGMRPPADELCAGAGSTGAVVFKVAVNGEVTLHTAGDATQTSLTGIKFLAA